MIKILELFAGIGACSTALKRLGIEHEIVDAVEIDKYAITSFNAIHGTNFQVQDITTWDKDIKVDLIMHGSPCQDFSLAGKQAGGDEGSETRSSLMYETIRIVEKLKPKYVIWENVKNVISKKHKHNFDNYINRMNELGYTSYYQVLNSKDYGIPQNRERVFTISIRKDIDKGFKFPEKQALKLKLKDMLEKNVDEKYYLSDEKLHTLSFNGNESGIIGKLKLGKFDINNRVYNDNDVCFTLRGKQPDQKILIHTIQQIEPSLLVRNATKKGYIEATNGDSINLSFPGSKTRRGRVGKQVCQTLQCNDQMGVINNLRIRKLTPLECWRLMGFNDEEFEKAKAVNSDTQLYKQAGNSIVVNVLVKLLDNLLKEDLWRK